MKRALTYILVAICVTFILWVTVPSDGAIIQKYTDKVNEHERVLSLLGGMERIGISQLLVIEDNFLFKSVYNSLTGERIGIALLGGVIFM
jgi:hypothetical protein